VSGTVTALVPTAGANQFAATTSVYNPYSYTYSSYSYSYPTYTGYGSTGSNVYGDTFGTTTAVLASGAIAGIAIFGVAYGCWYIAAAVVIMMMCKRSKRLTAAWDQPGGVNYRGPAGGSNVVGAYTVAAAVPNAPTPTMSPAPTQQQAGYFAPPMEQQQAKGVSPQQSTVSPVYGPGSPAPSYAPAANVSPYQNNGQPAQPYVYPAQQQYHEAPGAPVQPQGQHQPGNEVSELM
jgi:hypothetical protein